MDSSYNFEPHPHIEGRKQTGPVKITNVATRQKGSPSDRFNSWLALKVTTGVGTMWCAYIFGAIALISLPSALTSGSVLVIISWIAQTFLQLVLLSIIIVGQNIMAAASDLRSESTFKDAEAVLQTALQIQEHLTAQDLQLQALLAVAAAKPASPANARRTRQKKSTADIPKMEEPMSGIGPEPHHYQ